MVNESTTNWLECEEVPEVCHIAAFAGAALTVAALSPASGNASLPTITVESQASVGEPLPGLFCCSCGLPVCNELLDAVGVEPQVVAEFHRWESARLDPFV